MGLIKQESVSVSVLYLCNCYDSKCASVLCDGENKIHCLLLTHINHHQRARLSSYQRLGMIRHHVSIQWLYEQQNQTCVTVSETTNAELLLLIICRLQEQSDMSLHGYIQT